jgi:fructoselysine 6-kinase
MKRAIAMADNCIDVYYKLDRYYLTGNSIDFALNYRDLGGDVTEMTILGNDVFAMALEERLNSPSRAETRGPPHRNGHHGYCGWG